jgi:hypothetical protein
LNFENNQAWERASHAEVLVNAQPGQVTIAAGLPSWLIPAAIAFAALLLFLFLIFFFMRRRRPAPAVAPQPAYAPPTYAPPTLNTNAPTPPPAPLPSKPSSAPLDLPERRAATTAAGTDTATFKRAEDEFFKLKGQVGAGRITQAQFEEQLRALVVQDAQGRYWMLGADSGKWYVHDGTQWVERNPT